VRGKISQDRQSEDGSDAWRDFIEHATGVGWRGWEDYEEVQRIIQGGKDEGLDEEERRRRNNKNSSLIIS